ncbi:MAG: hypothetical protein NC099_06385 [Corallococcus sp.]|nr:hypothetical protein [Corallococcus sp.]
MFRKTHFEEIWFCKEYYIGDVDIMSDRNRQFIKSVDINLSDYAQNYPYKFLNDAKLYKTSINNRKFKFAIANLTRDVTVIAYLSYFSFMQAVKATDNTSRQRNKDNLRKLALEHAFTESSDDEIYIYAKDKMTRIRIEKEKNYVKASKQKFLLYPDATSIIPSNLKENPYEFLGWYEDEDNGISVYSDLETALKNISLQ